MLDPDPRIDGDAAVLPGEHRVQVQLRDLRQLLAEEAQAKHELPQSGLIGRRGAEAT